MTKRHRFRMFLASAALALGSLLLGLAPTAEVAAAERPQHGSVRAMTTVERLKAAGGVEGTPVGFVPADTLRAAKSRWTPRPIDAIPGTITVYNANNAASKYVFRVVTRSDRHWPIVQEFPVTLPAGSVYEYDGMRYDANYRLDVFADANANGIRDNGDFRVGRTKMRTSFVWARCHNWTTRMVDMVIKGDGVTPTPDPDPTVFADGTLVVIPLAGKTMTSAVFNGTEFTFQNVVRPNFGFVSAEWMSFYGFYNAAVTITAKYSDGTTSPAQTLTGPATPSADAVVWDITSQSPVTYWRSRVRNQGDFVHFEGAGTPYGQQVTLVIRLVASTDQSANPTITDTITRVVTAPASASDPSVYVTTSGAATSPPVDYLDGSVGVFLDSSGRVIYSVSYNGGGNNYWEQQP